MRKLSNYYIILFFSLIIISCDSPNSSNAAKNKILVNSENSLYNFVSNKNFNCSGNYSNFKLGSYYIKYSFKSNYLVELTLEDIRTNERTIFTQSYKVKSSKYGDTGQPFFYISIPTSGAPSGNEYWIYDESNCLIAAEGNWIDEDEYGLVIQEYNKKGDRLSPTEQ